MPPRKTKEQLHGLASLRRRLPHISASALAAVIQDVEENGVPELGGRNNVREARDAEVDCVTAFGPLFQTTTLETVSGSRMNLEYQNPFAMLQVAIDADSAFTKLFKARLQAFPSTPQTPWRLAMYSDEVVPGNALGVDNKRKIQAVYWSFLEFGAAALSQEDLWFVSTAKRSSEVKKVKGGMSQLMLALTRVFLERVIRSQLAASSLYFRMARSSGSSRAWRCSSWTKRRTRASGTRRAHPASATACSASTL